MKTTCFSIGLHLHLHNVDYIIDRITESRSCYLVRQSDGAIVIREEIELLTAYANSELVLHGTEKKTLTRRPWADLKALSEKRQKIAFYRYQYVKCAIKILGGTPTKKSLNQVIKKVMAQLDDNTPPSVSSVLRWWHIFVNAGSDIVALAGKPHKKTGHYAFNQIVLEEVFATIEEAYMSFTGESAIGTYNIFVHRMNRLNRARLNPLKIPSRPTFYRILSGISDYDKCAARKGQKTAEEKYRNTGAGPVVSRILQRVEVDHTPIDALVVDDSTGLPIGRPTFTCIIDSYSRMILGYYIGFETTSLVAVMRALRHAILPKDPTHVYMGTTEQHWPAFGIPHVLICDNGLEFHALDLDRIGAELNFDIQYCPKQQPRFKGCIERFLGTFNRNVSHNIPGATFSNVKQRGYYKSEELAIYNETEFVQRATQWVVDIYMRSIHSVTKRPPIAMWEEGLDTVSPLLPESEQALSFSLTKEATRTLTHSGIRIFNLFYNCPALADLRRYHEKSYKVDIRIDTECIRCIWVRDERSGDYIQVESTTPEYAHDLSLRQHTFIQKNLTDQGLQECDQDELIRQKERLYETKKELSKSKLISQRRKGAQISQEKAPSINSLVEDNINEAAKPVKNKKSINYTVVELEVEAP